MTETLRNQLSDYAMEGMIEIRNSQDPKERLHYFDVALESSSESNAVLLQKLYQDIVSHSAIDFGQIPDSQGALTKFKDYRTMADAIECINKLFAGNKSEEVDLMNHLHDYIIAARKDFAFGYQFDVDMIKLIYCTSVCTLMEIINLCILSYTKSLRKASGIEFSFQKVKKKDLIVIRSARSLLNSFESGEWNRIMNIMKKDPAILRPASEQSIAIEGDLKDIYDDIGEIAKGIAGNKGIAKVSAIVGKIPQFLKNTKAGKGAAIIAALIALFVGIRKLIFYFFKGRTKISEWIHTEKEFVKACYEHDIKAGNVSATTDKEKHLAETLTRMADVIEVKTARTDAEAKKSLHDANREAFSTKSLTDAKQGLSNIEF